MSRIYNVRVERLPESELVFKPEEKPVEKPILVHKSLYPLSLKRMPLLKSHTKKSQALPKIIDLRTSPKMPPVYDQGNLGSCTANALCAAFSFDLPTFIGSRLFVYYNERLIENSISIDAGASLSDGVKSLKTYGICPESSWPYVISQFASKPPESCYTSALTHKALTAYNIKNNLLAMQTSLVSGFPFVVGILVYSSFESQQVAKTGIVPMPGPKDQLLGGHAVLVCGYNDLKKQFIVRNSWGTNWGDAGYFYLPYAYLLNSRLSSDLWTINTVS
jgi:C1A family cysteine protease